MPIYADFFQCRFWEFQGGSEKIGINREKLGCPKNWVVRNFSEIWGKRVVKKGCCHRNKKWKNV